jgi:ParB-like chromosome segregation protein Spo0J
VVASLVRDEDEVGGLWSEQLLRRLRLTYSRMRVRIDAVDYRASLGVQARRKRLRPEVVQEYEESMLRGEVFPPIILCETSDRFRFLCPAGLHRLTAAKNVGETEIDAFVVKDATPEEIQRIAEEDNLKHGFREPLDDRLWKAEKLIARTGMTQAAAAARFLLPESRLRTHLRERQTEDRLFRMGLPPVDSKDARDRLAAVKSDVVFLAIATLPSDCLAAGVVGRMVTEINKAPSEAEQLAVVERVRSQHDAERRADAARPRGAGNSSPYAVLTRLANGSRGWPSPERVEREVPAILQPVLRPRLLAALARLQGIIEVLEP